MVHLDGMVPIRKISPNRVALTSYYGKTFVTRSEKRTSDYGSWLQGKINTAIIDGNTNIVNAYPGNVFNHEAITPRAYSSISMSYRRIDVSGFELYFGLLERTKMFSPEVIEKFEKRGSVILGKHKDGRIAILDKYNMVNIALPNSDPEVVSSVEEFLGFENKVPPIEFAEARIFGMNIPVGLVLGYLYGLEKLMSLLRVVPRRVPSGTRVNLQDYEYALTFSDETLVFNRDDDLAKLVLGGFTDYEKAIKSYSVYQFDKRAVYLNVLESKKITTRYLREIDLMDKLYVDPITESILKEMKEPITYRGLLIRSSELLLSDSHPRSLDLNFQRIKGYERVAGAVYGEMVNSIRDHRSKLGRSTATIDLKPFAIWKKVVGDPAVKITEDINPINALKEVEAVTFSGVGGRNSRSLTRESREYDPNDIGVISESTVDSSDVAINVYTSANPNFSSIRGLTNRATPKDVKSSQLFSTSALLAAGSDTDDPKRVNFIGIQNSHTIATVDARPVSVRTGYEQVVANRVGEGYASVAKQDGVVESVTETGIIVKYKDGKTEGFELGRRFGHAGGLTIPHTMATTLKVGEKFTAEDVIAYNSDWFEPDIVNKRNVMMKYGTIARVALAETKQTHEDASSITREFADRLSTKTTKVKKITVAFSQTVKNLIKEGSPVSFDTILCSIEDDITANNDLFDADTIDTLALLGNQTPTAKTEGVVERIEVYYNGSKDDMSSSLREIINESDRNLAKRLKSKGSAVFTGQVDESYRVDGEPLLLDNLVICVYMTSVVGTGVGDKGVFANQMKTVFSEIIDYDLRTESGLKLDAWFGAISIFKRFVNSPITIGTTNVLLRIAGENAYKAYKGIK